MKRLAWFFLGFFTVFGLIFSCHADAGDYVGLAIGEQTGHSWSTDNQIDSKGEMGYYGRLFYERGVDHDTRLDFTYSFSIGYLNFAKRDNDTMRIERVSALVPCIEGRAYLRGFWGLALYAEGGVGGELAEDGAYPLGLFGYGVEKTFGANKQWAISAGERTHFSTERRHGIRYHIGVKYSF